MTTIKQLPWITKLLVEKEYNFPTPTDEEIAGYDTKQASALLDILFNAPRKVTEATKAHDQALSELTEGYYLSPDDDVIKIVTTKDGLRHYGKVLVGTRWEYQGGLTNAALAGHKVTIEEAARHGWKTGRCLICGAELDAKHQGEDATAAVKLSVKRGIGPVCWKKLGGTKGTVLPVAELVAA